MADNNTSVTVEFDSNGNVSSMAINGEQTTTCNEPPMGEPEILATFGSNPAEGEGIEVLQYPSAICVHFFCTRYCPPR